MGFVPCCLVKAEKKVGRGAGAGIISRALDHHLSSAREGASRDNQGFFDMGSSLL
jgi:hypothetical protein